MSAKAGSPKSLLARCDFPPPGAPLACAVSGGADSLALLVLGVEAGCAVTAVHVDHGLRPGSAAEAQVVADAAAQFGAEFESRTVRVESGPNLEARARAARYAVLPSDVATGHTLDDQAETILLNVLRGAGVDGLAGMPPGVRKPLLRLRRSETVALCASVGLVPVEDPSNVDPSFRRNRVRHELLPLMNDVAGRDVAPILARQAALLRDEIDLLDSLAAEIDPSDARAIAAAPVALARRVVRRLLTGEHPPDAAAVERVLGVARGERLACEVAPGVRVSRSAGRLHLTPAPPPPDQTEL